MPPTGIEPVWIQLPFHQLRRLRGYGGFTFLQTMNDSVGIQEPVNGVEPSKQGVENYPPDCVLYYDCAEDEGDEVTKADRDVYGSEAG